MKKAVIISLGNKPILIYGISEMSTDEFLRLQKECDKNLNELVEKKNDLLRDVDTLKEQVEQLKDEIKFLKGE